MALKSMFIRMFKKDIMRMALSDIDKHNIMVLAETHFDMSSPEVLSKGEIVKQIISYHANNGEKVNIDTAIPLDWSNKIKDFGIDPAPYVWIYDRKSRGFGKPLHIYDALKEIHYAKKHKKK